MKLLLGIIIGAAISGGIFYCINKNNQEKTAAFLASIKAAHPVSMSLSEPEVESTTGTINVKNPLTIIIGKNDNLFYFNGKDCGSFKKIPLTQLRSQLKLKKQQTNPDDLMILIKNTAGSSFKMAIDVLDEISIAGITPGHYAEVDITESDKKCIENYKEL